MTYHSLLALLLTLIALHRICQRRRALRKLYSNCKREKKNLIKNCAVLFSFLSEVRVHVSLSTEKSPLFSQLNADFYRNERRCQIDVESFPS